MRLMFLRGAPVLTSVVHETHAAEKQNKQTQTNKQTNKTKQTNSSSKYTVKRVSWQNAIYVSSILRKSIYLDTKSCLYSKYVQMTRLFAKHQFTSHVFMQDTFLRRVLLSLFLEHVLLEDVSLCLILCLYWFYLFLYFYCWRHVYMSYMWHNYIIYSVSIHQSVKLLSSRSEVNIKTPFCVILNIFYSLQNYYTPYSNIWIR